MTAASAAAHDSLRILFVGNSLTYYNNLPGMVRAVYAAAVPDATVTTEMLASGGALIRDHIDRGQLQNILAIRHFDVVVLQELGGFPLCSPDFPGCADSPQAIEKAVSLVRSAGARPILLGTWTNPALQPDLSAATREIAKGLNAQVADIGAAIAATHTVNHTMLDATGHPTSLASWLAALVLVKSMTLRPLPVKAPAQVCEPDWTGTGPSEDSLASQQAQPPIKCFSISETLFRELRRVANE